MIEALIRRPRFVSLVAPCRRAIGLASYLGGRSQPRPSAADSHALIEGSGSSWAANAVNQWVADVASQGIQVVYTPDGDAQGRQDFANRTSDFAVTSIGYQGVDPVTGVNDTSQGRPYAYLPIAAGGTSFPYQIRYDGKQVRNLRLSGETIAKIFTEPDHQLGRPGDHQGQQRPCAAVAPDHAGRAVRGLRRDRAADPVLRHRVPEHLAAYSRAQEDDRVLPAARADQIAQNGSDGAMNYVSSKRGQRRRSGMSSTPTRSAQNYPVAKMLNKAGYYTLPTQYNVAVALEKAQINMDKSSPNYLLQNLNNVYTDPDPRTYPLSSYVYMIEPTGTYRAPRPKITTAKRQSIADFLYYSICQGQKEIGPIGYSPLPVNLVEAGFGQIEKLKQADSGDRPERTATSRPATTRPSSRDTRTRTIWRRSRRCRRLATRLAPARALPASPNGTGPAPTTTIPDTTTTTLGGGHDDHHLEWRGAQTTTTSGGGGLRRPPPQAAEGSRPRQRSAAAHDDHHVG